MTMTMSLQPHCFCVFFDDDVIAVDKNEQQWVCSMGLVVLVYWTIWFNVPVKPSSATTCCRFLFGVLVRFAILDWYKIGPVFYLDLKVLGGITSPEGSSLPSPPFPLRSRSLRSRAPWIQLEGLGEHCKLPSGVRGRAHRFLRNNWPENGLWWQRCC